MPVPGTTPVPPAAGSLGPVPGTTPAEGSGTQGAGMPPPSAPPPGTGPVQPAPPALAPVDLEANARIQLDATKAFEAQIEDDLFQRLAVIQSYQDVIKVYPGTQAAEEARQAIERIRKAMGAEPETPSESPPGTPAPKPPPAEPMPEPK